MRQHKRMGRKDVRRRRESALERLPRYVWEYSKRVRKLDLEVKDAWLAKGNAEIATLQEKLATTKDTSYDY